MESVSRMPGSPGYLACAPAVCSRDTDPLGLLSHPLTHLGHQALPCSIRLQVLHLCPLDSCVLIKGII